eukprot:g11475.t1
MRRRASLSATNDGGLAALHLSTLNGHLAVALYLVKAGAELEAIDYQWGQDCFDSAEVLMLPLLRRRARKHGLVMAPLFRHSVKTGHEPASNGGGGGGSSGAARR